MAEAMTEFTLQEVLPGNPRAISGHDLLTGATGMHQGLSRRNGRQQSRCLPPRLENPLLKAHVLVGNFWVGFEEHHTASAVEVRR